MAISIFEATKLKTFRNFRLVSGVSGLDNSIEKVGILDWEFAMKLEGQFVSGEFVLTSLLFAKDNPDFILEAILDLINYGATGLAVKNVYYNELPDDVIALSNEHAFPIFIFDNTAYFEDIITEVTDRIRFADNYELLETKVDVLIKKHLDKTTVKEIAYEINSSFKEHFYVVYLKKKNYLDTFNMISLLDQVKKSKNLDIYSCAIKYRNGILIIFTEEKLDPKLIKIKAKQTLERLGIDLETFWMGVSRGHFNLNELDFGINESFYAQRTSEISSTPVKHYDEIGIYGVLMPYKDDFWMTDFYNRIITPIKEYDEKHGTELFTTGLKYIENDGNGIATSEALFLHKNTVRYRIDKIKELLKFDAADGSFYEQLSFAMKLHRIYHS